MLLIENLTISPGSLRLGILRMFTLAISVIVLSACGMHASDTLTVQPVAVNVAELQWGQAGDGSVAPVGTRTAPQGVDPNTGGVTYYAWFPAGGHFDLHWHSHNEFVTVVQGPVTIALGEHVHNLQTGAYVVIPGGLPHYWDVPASGDAIILVRRAGPADFHFVNR